MSNEEYDVLMILSVIWSLLGIIPTFRLWKKIEDNGDKEEIVVGLWAILYFTWWLGPIAYYIQLKLLK